LLLFICSFFNARVAINAVIVYS